MKILCRGHGNFTLEGVSGFESLVFMDPRYLALYVIVDMGVSRSSMVGAAAGLFTERFFLV